MASMGVSAASFEELWIQGGAVEVSFASQSLVTL